MRAQALPAFFIDADMPEVTQVVLLIQHGRRSPQSWQSVQSVAPRNRTPRMMTWQHSKAESFEGARTQGERPILLMLRLKRAEALPKQQRDANRVHLQGFDPRAWSNLVKT